MKKYVFLPLVTLVMLAGCRAPQKEVVSTTTSTGSNVTTQSNSTPQFVKVGDTVTLDGAYNLQDKGLKVTVTEVSVDQNLQLNQEYSSQDFTGYTPIIVKSVFENPTNNYIDTTVFTILDSEGETGKWQPYLEGVSSQDPDGLAPGQKFNSTMVFGVKNPKSFDISYDGVTWRFKN